MPGKRVIQAGHFLALVFVTLLLIGARHYLGAHPLSAGLLLAAFAPAYYAAARVTGYRHFLYPAVLLLVLAYHLLLHAAGVPPALQPLCALLPVALLTAAARRGMPARPDGAPQSLHGANALIIAALAAWVLLRVSWFHAQAPLATALALAGYAAYAWLRFLDAPHVRQVLSVVVLGSASFLLFLYSYPQLTLLAGALAGAAVAADLGRRRVLGRPELIALALAGTYILYMGVAAPPAAQQPLGYLLIAALWLHLGLMLNRPGQAPMLGPHPAPLPRLLPLFTAGIVLALVPVALFYPWRPAAQAVAYLAVFFVVVLGTGRELAQHAFSLVGVAVARLLAGLGRAAPLAALVLMATEGFPASYRVALGALSICLLSLLAGWRQEPRLLVRRNPHAYQAGAFFVLAYFLAERRLAASGNFQLLLGSGELAVLAVIATGWLLRNRVQEAYQRSLYEAASLAAIVACLMYPLRWPIAVSPAAVLGLYLMLAGALAFAVVRRPTVLFSVPVALGFWLYVAEWLAGVRGESLGLSYLAFAFLWAAAGYWLLRRRSEWYELLYFMWFLSVAVSLSLFAPFQAVGAYAAPLSAVAFLVVARGAERQRDFAFALALETTGLLLAAASTGVLLWQRLYLPAAVAFFVYALLFAWLAVRRRLWPYLYPAAACAVVAFHLGLLAAGSAHLSLPWFFAPAAFLYGLGIMLRRAGRRDLARPLELAAGAGAAVGTIVLLAQPFGRLTAAGVLSGLAYLALFLLLTRLSRDHAFLAGAALGGGLAIYELLPRLPGITASNRLAFFTPVALLLVILGRRQQRTRDGRGGWALYAAAMVMAVAGCAFVLWPAPARPPVSSAVLLVALAVWLALLVWTGREILVYSATLTLAVLAYNFVQNSADLFGQHLVAFFLYGTAALGVVFLAAVTRSLLRFRRPLLFTATGHWRARFLYLIPVVLLGAAIFGGWAVTTSSNPIFCGTCHQMNTYFANWKSSAHASAQVGCAACHYEPGLRGYVRAKVQGFSELVVALTGTQRGKPTARVGDETCLRSGCHARERLPQAQYVGGKFYFRHGAHLGALERGPELRCTSCHADTGPESHFAVDTNACFTCHFRAASPPRPATAVGCVACHGVPQGPRGSATFDHGTAGVARTDSACAACHAGVSRGSGAVEQRRCRHCHIERAERLMPAGISAIHARHVRGEALACDWCHSVIRHGAD